MRKTRTVRNIEVRYFDISKISTSNLRTIRYIEVRYFDISKLSMSKMRTIPGTIYHGIEFRYFDILKLSMSKMRSIFRHISKYIKAFDTIPNTTSHRPVSRGHPDPVPCPPAPPWGVPRKLSRDLCSRSTPISKPSKSLESSRAGCAMEIV